MNIRITSIESYADFATRCKALHKEMLKAKELGLNELVAIEGLIYAYAQAIIAKKEYDELPVQEKKRLYQQGLEAKKQLLQFTSENNSLSAKLKNNLDIDKFLNN